MENGVHENGDSIIPSSSISDGFGGIRITRSQTRKSVDPFTDESTSSDTSSEQRLVKKRKRGAVKAAKSKKKSAVNNLRNTISVIFVRIGPLSGEEGKRKCLKCLQYLSDVKMCVDPEDAVGELALLDDEDRCIKDTDGDGRPSVSLTMFSVYDQFGHLCPFDTGLIETNDFIFMNGYAKIIVADDPSIQDGLPLTRIGPIESWWIWGFDGGKKTILGFSTDLVNYYTMCPAPEYAPFINMNKIKLSKYVIDYIQENPSNSFEEMCDFIKDLDSDISDEFILLYAGFLASQIKSYDSQADWDELALKSTRIARRLITLAGDEVKQTNRQSKVVFKERKKMTVKSAATTPLVSSLLKGFFEGRSHASDGKNQRVACQNCEACLRPPCNQCKECRSNSSLCIKKQCQGAESKLIQLDEESDEEDVQDDMDLQVGLTLDEAKRKVASKRQKVSTVRWKSAAVKVEGCRTYYSSVAVGNILVEIGDCLAFAPECGNEPYLGKVCYMYEENAEKMLHVTWFWRGSETILGEAACQSELFSSNACDSVPAGSVVSQCVIECKDAHAYFLRTSTISDAAQLDNFRKDVFYYSRRYDHVTARFEVAPAEMECKVEERRYNFCCSCEYQRQMLEFEKPLMGEHIKGEYQSFHLRGEEYVLGECVFISPHKYSIFTSRKFECTRIHLLPNTDKEMYPERYRKTTGVIRGSNNNVPDPFVIGRILSLVKSSQTKKSKQSDADDCEKIQVAVFYRPENTCLGDSACYSTDFNMLYWSDHTLTVDISSIMGKCVVAFADNIEDLQSFYLQGPYRFYFKEAYDPDRETFLPVPVEAKSYSGKGKGNAYEDYPAVPKKLKSLDCFCGCGGLSDGFHRAGICETHWAIENNGSAAEAFRQNNPNSIVYEEDCNELLRMAMNGKVCDKNGQPLPKKGEIDIIMGGPPCQGFSGMNRFSTREYSTFQNSLVATFLSICEYYRPRYFILENVRNFVSYKKNMVLKQVLNCLVRIGYQCMFAVLQAGHYGIPQTRRRMIIIAAAPGEKLPNFPEPLHVFDVVGPLSVCIDNMKIKSNIRWTDSAPFRTVTVNDALCDLPEIQCGASNSKIPYGNQPITHFQRIMRDNGDILKDHVTKPMNDLTVERFRHIPVTPGADWRDLPNIEIRKKGVLIAAKLKYPYFANDGTKRGVCKCAAGNRECDPDDRQSNTLIPWCLPHTGDRHDQWSGLFGRLSSDGHFSTTITNPEPMGKQGCVIHPTQHRVVSIRECARSQGFNDSYNFSGSVLDRYRQVGNAVPPPLAKFLGLELRKSLFG